MTDIKRLTKAWEIFRDSNPYQICNGKEFRAIKEPEYCMGQMIDDTLALLKKQDPVKPIEKAGFYYCVDCKYALASTKQNFCPYCGRAVKWE